MDWHLRKTMARREGHHFSKPKPEIKPTPKNKMKFEVFKGEDGQYYFRLRSSNGKIVAPSEGYKRKQSALKTIAAIQKKAADAEIQDLTI